MSKKERKDPAYLREQGKRQAKAVKQRKITFCLSKHITNQGQTIEDWDESELLVLLFNRLKFIGQYTSLEVRQNKYIKEYTKVDFPPNSEFKKPTHIGEVTWAVMHITTNSKEVVVGYIDEDDIFYIIFLDKEHKFWPSTLKNT
jgi:hypothetical protein